MPGCCAGPASQRAGPLAGPGRGLLALQFAQQQLQVQPQEARVVAQESLCLDGRHTGVVALLQRLYVLEANASRLLDIGEGQLFGFAGLAQTLAQSSCIAHACTLPDDNRTADYNKKRVIVKFTRLRVL